ncbi:hypothetical protein EDB19DRAFT_1833369 [Suillus lakei]|nr:hypothetical protein EDB19DRAFT_1833369 [Suillus lakei]
MFPHMEVVKSHLYTSVELVQLLYTAYSNNYFRSITFKNALPLEFPKIALATITGTTNPGPPLGATGKDTRTLNPDQGRNLTDTDIELMTDTIGWKPKPCVDLSNRDAVVGENTVRSHQNQWKAQIWDDPDSIEIVSEDEEMLDLPPHTSSSSHSDQNSELTDEEKILKIASTLGGLTPTMKQIMSSLVKKELTGRSSMVMDPVSQDVTSEAPVFTAGNMIHASATSSVYEIPCPLIVLARSKIHVPLMLLTTASLRRIHADPSCMKMKKGLVMDDPKRTVMDMSVGFPVEMSLLPGQFNEAYTNFMKLLTIVADETIVQEFKIDESTYMQRWSKIKIDMRLVCQENQASGNLGSSNRTGTSLTAAPTCKPTRAH